MGERQVNALEVINRICNSHHQRVMSGQAQCRDCGAIFPVCAWQDGAVMLMGPTENVGGGGGDPPCCEFVCPRCGERDTKEDLTIDQLFEIEEAEYAATEKGKP